MPNKQHNRRGACITHAQEDHATRRGIPRFLALVPAAEEEQSMGGQRGGGGERKDDTQGIDSPAVYFCLGQ